MPEIFDGDFEWIEPEEPLIAEEAEAAAEPAKKQPKVWKKIGAAALALGIAVGITETVQNTHIKKSHGQTIVDIFPRYVERTETFGGPRGCPAVKPAQIQRVKSILREKHPKLGVQDYLSGSHRYEEVPKIIREEIEGYAKGYGLTLVDERPFQKKLDAAGFNFKEQLKTVNEFSEQYGFAVSVYTGHKDKNLEPFTTAEFANYDFITGLSQMMNVFRFMPVEEVRATGLRKLQIVKGFNRGHIKEPSIAAQAVGSDLIQVSLGSLIETPEELYHEMGHLEDYNFCGNFGFNYYDAALNRLNPDGFEYGVGIYWRNATVSQYGSSNAMEDKAEILGHLLEGVDNSVAHSSYRAVREKYDLELARANARTPKLAQYLEILNH